MVTAGTPSVVHTHRLDVVGGAPHPEQREVAQFWVSASWNGRRIATVQPLTPSAKIGCAARLGPILGPKPLEQGGRLRGCSVASSFHPGRPRARTTSRSLPKVLSWLAG